MTAQKRSVNTHHGIQRKTPPRQWKAATTALTVAALAGCVVPAIGCKTGTSLAKPSWWTFGGTPKTDPDSLAAAPPYGGDIKKPSESAKQYPTTSTPSGYVITGSSSASGTVAPQIQSAQVQAPVVYGSTPAPPSTPAGALVEAASPAFSQPAAPSTVAPQVGPYAALAGDSIPPPGQPLPPIAPSTTPSPLSATMPSMAATPATPAEAALPNTAYAGFSGPSSTAAPAASMNAAPMAGVLPPPRMADSRAADPAAAIPAGALPVESSTFGGSRYSTGTGSRFGGAEAASFSPAVAPATSPANPVDSGFSGAGLPVSGLPASGTGGGSAGPASASPYGSPSTVGPPANVPPTTPQATPGLLQPSTQPVRRPDPGYRPGGTSSYRPSRTILADDSMPSTAVRTASYEEPAGTTRQ